HDRQILKLPQRTSDCRSRCAGVENYDLPLGYHRCRSRRNSQLLFAIQLLFFAQRGIFQGTMPGRQRSTVSAVYKSVTLEGVEVFAYGYLRGRETPRQGADEHASITLQHFEDRAAAFFVK